jgi:hypothetical protein
VKARSDQALLRGEIRHRQYRNREVRRLWRASINQHRHRPGRHRLRDVRGARGAKTRHGDEQVTRLDTPAVVAQAGHADASRRGGAGQGCELIIEQGRNRDRRRHGRMGAHHRRRSAA